MEKKWLSNIWFIIIAIAVIAGIWYSQRNSIDTLKTTTPALPEPSEESPPEFATVEKIIDGDELLLNTGHRVRYLGVRVPKVTDKIQCYGPEAVMANEFILGQQVRLESDPLIDRASDGAWLRYAWLIQGEADVSPSPSPNPSVSPDGETSPLVRGDGGEDVSHPDKGEPEGVEDEEPRDQEDIFINERILETGFAVPVVSEDMVYGQQLLNAGRFAASTEKGLWGQCEISNTPTGHTITNEEQDCAIKGIKAESGERIYREPSCAAYAETIVLPSQNEGQYFCDSDEAQINDFKRASDCPPL